MATTIQNGITFNNIYKDGGTKVVDTIKQDTWNPNAAYPSSANFPLVNAVDIAWNGAQLNIDNQDITINTTGELLNVVTNLANMAINNLRTAQTLLNQIAPSPEETE